MTTFAAYRVLVAIVLLVLPLLAAVGGHDATDARRKERRPWRAQIACA